MQSIPLVFFLTVAILVGGCNTTPHPTRLTYEYVLSESQITGLAKKAQAGDATAAFRLYEYYHLVSYDRDKAISWLTKSANNGNVVAQYNMGMMYNGEIYPDLTDIKKAEYWFKRAADNGDIKARRKLEELQ